jgi:hypothetical protein
MGLLYIGILNPVIRFLKGAISLLIAVLLP